MNFVQRLCGKTVNAPDSEVLKIEEVAEAQNAAPKFYEVSHTETLFGKCSPAVSAVEEVKMF